jgi:hypothetical protein
VSAEEVRALGPAEATLDALRRALAPWARAAADGPSDRCGWTVGRVVSSPAEATPAEATPAEATPGATTRPPSFDIEGSAEGMRESGGEGGGDAGARPADVAGTVARRRRGPLREVALRVDWPELQRWRASRGLPAKDLRIVLGLVSPLLETPSLRV